MTIQRFSGVIDAPASPALSPGSVYAELLASATRAISVRAIRVTTLTANGGNVGLARAFAVGTAAATGVATGMAHRMVATTTARLRAAWSSSGIAPTGFGSRLRDVVMPNATGSSYDLWREEDGLLTVEPGSSLLLVNGASGVSAAGLRIAMSWEENA